MLKTFKSHEKIHEHIMKNTPRKEMKNVRKLIYMTFYSLFDKMILHNISKNISGI